MDLNGSAVTGEARGKDHEEAAEHGNSVRLGAHLGCMRAMVLHAAKGILIGGAPIHDARLEA